MKKFSQGLIEYILVFIFASIVLYFFAGKIDLSKLKTFAVYGIKKPSSPAVIVIPPMTD